MVGGGPGGFIGQVHRHAMCLDGNYKLVAGVFSRDPTTSAALGASLGICSSRLYTSFEQMAESEAALPVEERIELCVVVTPTPTHAEAALAFISRGFPVVCDKPLCSTIGANCCWIIDSCFPPLCASRSLVYPLRCCLCTSHYLLSYFLLLSLCVCAVRRKVVLLPL